MNKQFINMVNNKEVLLVTNFHAKEASGGCNTLIHKSDLNDFINTNNIDGIMLSNQHIEKMFQVASGELKQLPANEKDVFGLTELHTMEELYNNLDNLENCGFFTRININMDDVYKSLQR